MRLPARSLSCLLSAAIAWAAAWTALAPVVSFAECDLSKVVVALAPSLPLFEASPADFKDAYSHGTRQFGSEIVFSDALRLKTGIRKIRKLGVLGSGGIGVVYEVEVEYVKGPPRRMAWKELTSTTERKLERERNALAIQHEAAQASEGVVPIRLVLDVREGEQPSTVVALSELGGSSLHSCMWPETESKPPLGPSQRLRLAEIVAEQGSRILAGLRRRGIVHYDIKPENFVVMGGEKNDLQELLDGKAHLALLDFGLSLRKGEKHPTLAGTPAYFSPWMAQDHVALPANDLYALGIILAEILMEEGTTNPQVSRRQNPSQYPRPGFSAAEVRTDIDWGIKSFFKGVMGESTPGLARLNHLEQYVLHLLGSTKDGGPTEIFAPNASAGAISSELPYGPKPRKLPVVEVQARDLKSAYSHGAREFGREIVFPPELENRTGIHKITKGRELGRGASGVVHEVEVQYTGGGRRRMALKELAMSQSGMLDRERAALKLQYEAAQRNDGVVPVDLLIEVWDAERPSAIAELSELGGASLSSCLWPAAKSGVSPLSASQRLRLAEIVAEQGSRILAGLRRHRVVHHDLKPGNLVIVGGEKNDLQELLDGKARLALVDFGLALREGEKHSHLAGTPAYFSPWMAQDHRARSTNDLYALGVTLAEILTETRPVNPPEDLRHRPSRYPAPGFSAEQVKARIDRGIKASGSNAGRVERLEQYVLRLLGSASYTAPTEVFVP